MAKTASQRSIASNLRPRKANAPVASPKLVKAAPRNRYGASPPKGSRTWLAVRCGSIPYIRANDTWGEYGVWHGFSRKSCCQKYITKRNNTLRNARLFPSRLRPSGLDLPAAALWLRREEDLRFDSNGGLQR